MRKIVSVLILLAVICAFSGIASATSSSSYTSSSWEKTSNPYKGQIAYKETSKSTYKTTHYSSLIQTTTIGKVTSYTSSKIKVKCIETTITTTWDSYFGKNVEKSTRTYYMTLYR
jgi:hypothetical protein